MAASATDLVAVLPRVCKIIVLSGCATGLMLNLKKCQLVFPDEETCTQATHLCREAGIRIRQFVVSRCGWYLGVGVGIEASEKSWAPVLAKLKERCLRIKSMGLGLSSSIGAYNVYGLPVVSHVSQVHVPPPCALKVEKDGLQLLTCSPRHSFPPMSLFNLRWLGHQVEARRLETYARACMIRAATRSSLTSGPSQMRSAWPG
eukprot:1363068-Pyramimonas_sp.AAC.1